LATASLDETVKVWDAATGQYLLTLQAHTHGAMGLAFAPDQTVLATAGADRAVRLWPAAPLSAEFQAMLRASSAVVSHLREPLVKEELLEGLRRDLALDGVVRARALALAEQYAEDPARLNALSWEVVRRPGATAAEYRAARRWAEAACRLAPKNSNYLNTLGVAQYRAGQHQAAEDTLARSDAIHAAGQGGSHPADLAFLAMAQHRLGQKDKAQESIRRLREAMKAPRWAEDAESRAFLREAEALLQDAPIAPKN
jgi:hypothetical protein